MSKKYTLIKDYTLDTYSHYITTYNTKKDAEYQARVAKLLESDELYDFTYTTYWRPKEGVLVGRHALEPKHHQSIPSLFFNKYNLDITDVLGDNWDKRFVTSVNSIT
jgi:hypothetical protein